MRVPVRVLSVAAATLFGFGVARASTTEYTFGHTGFSSIVDYLIIDNAYFSAVSTGNYTQDGTHLTGNTGYIAGQIGDAIYRDYFVFDLRGLVGPVTSAVLAVAQYYPDGYVGPASGATYRNYDVSTPVPDLVGAQTDATATFADLGSGTVYASTLILPVTTPTQVDIAFDAAGLSAIAAAEGRDFAIGGGLDLGTVPLPGSALLFGAALLALGAVGSAWRRVTPAAT